MDLETLLHAKGIAHRPGIRADEGAMGFIRKSLDDRFQRADKLARLEREGGLAALLLLTAQENRRYRSPERELLLLADPDDLPMDWIRDRLDEFEPLFERDTFITLERSMVAIAPELRARGFAAAKIWLQGNVGDALAALERGPAPETSPVDFELMEAPDVEFAVRMRREFFDAHPELGYGSLKLTDEEQAYVDSVVRGELLEGCEDERAWIVREHGEPVGCFGLSVNTHPLFGRMAGVDIFFQPSLHRRGLSRAAYLTMLRRAADIGVEQIRGVTSNPAVIHLGKLMGRVALSWTFRRRGPFIGADVAGV